MTLSIAILTVVSLYREGGPIREAWRRDRLDLSTASSVRVPIRCAAEDGLRTLAPISYV
jgi:hypothetical protein